jgi:Phosphoenolpyruvate-dependent sugar phosphotransferase system, EIIA 2.
MIQEDLIFVKLKVTNREELFERLSGELLAKGYVKESFLKGLLDREKEYPTGLQLNGYGCALPHTEIEHVHESAIVIATMDNPIIFRNMESPADEVEVSVVFMLALSKPGDKVETLKQLVALIQQESLMKKMMEAETKEELLDILRLSVAGKANDRLEN